MSVMVSAVVKFEIHDLNYEICHEKRKQVCPINVSTVAIINE